MDTLLCNDDGTVIIGTYDPTNTLLRLSADQYTAGSATWADQSGNGLNFTVSTNANLKGTDADGFPYMDFGGSYGSATRTTNIPTPVNGAYTVFCVTQVKNSTATWRSLMFGSGDIQLIIQSGSNSLGLYNGGFVDSGFDVTTDMTSSRNLLVVEVSETAPIFKFQLNESGTDSTINSSTGFAIPFNTIGTNNNNYWGNIYEFIVYDGRLSASDRAYVAEYLAYKWGIYSKLPSPTSTQGILTLDEIGAFDVLGSTVSSASLGTYSLRRIFGAYTGPQVKIRRSTDNAETDIYFDKYGNMIDFNLTTWLNGATAHVTTWYDQSGNAKNITQTTAGSQPILTAPSGERAYIRFQNKIMTGPNVFGSSSVTNMHLVVSLRENSRSSNYFISLNGTNTINPGRFFIHAPWNDGVWYYDAGSAVTDRAYSTATVVGDKTVFSGYKSSTVGNNGFRLNGGTRYVSSQTNSADVTGGIRIGSYAADHSLYDMFIFSSKLSDSNESYIEWNAA